MLLRFVPTHAVLHLLQGLLIALLSVGCTREKIEPTDFSPAAKRLLGMANQPIFLEVGAPQTDLTAGHQYVLVFMPFGRVILSQPARHLKNAAELALAERGYRWFSAGSDSEIKPRYHLALKLEAVQATAYDFIFLRRIVCRITLSAELRSSDERLLRLERAVGRSTSWKRFAFAPQLNYVFNRALTEGMRELLNSLLLRPDILRS